MDDQFAHLLGRSLVSLARAAAGDFTFDRIYRGADGSVSIDNSVRWMISVGPVTGTRLVLPPDFLDAIAALADGRLGLVADGDESLGHAADIAVPLGLLRGSWHVVVEEDAAAYLCDEDPNGRDVGAHYRRPRFAPPATADRDKKPPAESSAGPTKTRRAPVSAAMVDWYGALSARQRKKTPNALADLYVNEDPGRREQQHRQACRVFADPDKYRGR